jgi:pyruvate dehydrogenase E2 component (dihydrolipoamide acetyltransferase)
MQIIMPKLGLTMTEGTVTKWCRAEGEAFQQGEILFEFESEKSALEFEAPIAGVLTEVLVAEGQTVPCGTPVCMVRSTIQINNQPAQATAAPIHPSGQNLSPAPALAAATTDGRIHYPATPRAKARAHELQLDLAGLQGSGPEGRIQLSDVEQFWARQGQPALDQTPPAPKMTPVAKRLAADQGVDPAAVASSIPSGRITKEDVARASQAATIATPASPDGELIPLSPTRQVIAQRLSQSAFSALHVTLFTEADATHLVEARAQLNAELPPDQKIAYNALLAAICARALREQPQLNAVFDQAANGIRLLSEINIALAVETERGLATPVLNRVDTLNLAAIQKGYAALIERALAGQLKPADLAGGTFTLTSLGAYEVDGFTPIINPPQVAILGVGRIRPKPVAQHNEVVIRQMLTLSLSFDHRAIDGVPAARFLQRIKQLVERPFALML